MPKIKKIALLTSGGDSPGMNAAVRGVVRTAIVNGLEVCGVRRGYQGLIEADFLPMHLGSVSGIVNQGGTVLLSARSEEFKTEEGMRRAFDNLDREGINALIVIGGDGTFRGAHALWSRFRFPTVGVPASIDNDIAGTDFSIGFDTAVNTALEVIDKIRDTATSHERLFIVEVMGRNRGFIALEVGLAGGAEAILVPEVPFSIEEICARLEEGRRRGKLSSIIVVAEGVARAFEVAKEVEKRGAPFEMRVCVLGHLQRGGNPTAFDRVLASRLAAEAVRAILEGDLEVMVGVEGQRIVRRPLAYPAENEKPFDMEKYQLATVLAS